MRKSLATISCAAIALALSLTGCGSNTAATATTPGVPIAFKSAGIAGRSIPALYTCDGKNVTPPVEWGAVPAGTKELVLLIVGLTPATKKKGYSVSIEWAVAGIDPTLHHLTAGRLPKGAHVGFDSLGEQRYSICPRKGVSEDYQFQLFAVPTIVKIPKGFAGLPTLAALSRPHSPVAATGQGAFVARYKRS